MHILIQKFGSAFSAAIALLAILAISACPMPNATDTTDTTAPRIESVSPSGENINVSDVSEIVITFTEPIQLVSGASGNINLIALGGATISFAVPSDQVIVQGRSVTINGIDLTAGTTYRVAIPAGLIADSAGNTNPEITASSEAISFTTAADTFPPRVQSFSAEGDSVDPSTNRITITFNEEIQRGTGSISLESAGATTQTFNIAASTMPEETLVSGNTLVLLGVNLSLSTAYSIHFPAGLVSDTATTPNPVAALTSENTTLRFRTSAADVIGPGFLSISPMGDSVEAGSTTELIIRFNENIQAGAGSITLMSNAPSVDSFDVSNTAQVTVGTDSLTLLELSLVQGTEYSLEIPAGAVLDSANNPNAQIPAEGATAIGFSTRETVPPAFASIDPSGSEVNASTVSNIAITFSENIRQGTGTVLLFENGSEIMQFSVADATQVRIEGRVLSLLSPMLLQDSPNAYSIRIPAGAVLDNANNPNAQIPAEGATAIGFSTRDSAPPVFVNITIDPITMYGVEGRARFNINFNERILPIEGGEIRMTDSASTDTQVFRFEFNDIFSGANIDVISVGDNLLQGNLYRSDSSHININTIPGSGDNTATLHLDRTYTIRIPAGIISDDLAGFRLAIGRDDNNIFTYNERNNLNEEIVIEFTPSVMPTPPAIMGTPQRNGQNIVIRFNEFLGGEVTGEIELSREGFSQNYSARNISISGSTIALLGASAAVTPGVEHSIRIPVGAIQDILATTNTTELSVSFTIAADS